MIRILKRKCYGKIVLTYDDGPGPELESKLLITLKQYDAKATFFLHGKRAERFPEQCNHLFDKGHELGCHCYAHLNAYKTAPWKILEDIKKAYHVLDKWISKDKIFRPPHGKLTLSLCFFLLTKKCKIVFWTVNSGDTYSTLPEPDSIVQKVVRENGAVVLLHSFDRDSRSKEERSNFVISITMKLLQAAKDHNLEICKINDLYDRA